jgi:hypothetical protein
MTQIICTCSHSINDHTAHRLFGHLIGRCEMCACRLTPEEVAEAEYQRRDQKARETSKSTGELNELPNP